MSIDGLVISKIVESIKDYLPIKINKIQQVSDYEIVFNIHNKDYNKLLISAISSNNRVNLTNSNFTNIEVPTNFLMVLRKYIDRGIIVDINQHRLDRVIRLTINVINELGDHKTYFLVIDLMGKYSNIILLDSDNKIIIPLKILPAYDITRRLIHPGAIFRYMDIDDIKIDLYDANIDLDTLDNINNILGISKYMMSELRYRIEHNESYTDILDEISRSKSLYIYEDKYMSTIQLKHLSSDHVSYNVNEAIDKLFNNLNEKDRIKQHTNNIDKLVKRKIKKIKNKILKLNDTLSDAHSLELYKKYGDILYCNTHLNTRNNDFISLLDYDTNEEINIPLDIRYDLKTNAKKYYQKYKKCKTAIDMVNKQLVIANDELEYFYLLESQIELCNVDDAIEIRKELVAKGYIKGKIKADKRFKEPRYNKVLIDGIVVYYGKNNIQNEYITHKLANRNDLYMHVKDIHGSHVVIADANPSENVLRKAAMIAAYFSKARYSSSIPVNYCYIKDVKKAPKNNPGLVLITNYKTIYIDIDDTYIKENAIN